MRDLASCIRWVARVTGSLLVALFLLFALGEGFHPFHLTAGEAILSVALWTALAGLIVAWRREGLGAALAIGGAAAFYLIHFARVGRMPGGWVFPLLWVPALGFALDAWLRGGDGAPQTHGG